MKVLFELSQSNIMETSIGHGKRSIFIPIVSEFILSCTPIYSQAPDYI